MSVFALLKGLHILAACLWIGGNSTTTVLLARLTAAPVDATLTALVQLVGSVGHWIVGPSAAVSLVTGGSMVGLYHIGQGASWVVWGLAGIALSLTLWFTLIRREMKALVSPDLTDDARSRTRQRLLALNGVNLAILVGVVWAMVTKPA